MLKDPYNFGFLSLEKNALERDLERGLLGHLRDFMLEMGVGFSFVGSQYPLTVDGKEYRLDLLFYHFRLHCFVVIDLKNTDFQPEYAGKMNFYLSAADELLRREGDHSSIEIILCKGKSKTEVEYILRGMSQPLGVSSYFTSEILPRDLEQSLPSVEMLERELKSLNWDSAVDSVDE